MSSPPKNIRRKNPAALAQLYERMSACIKSEVAVGFPKGKTNAYPESGASVPEVAAKQCYGIGVPVRDFMTLGKEFIDKDAKIKEIFAEIAKETSNPDWNPKVVAALQEAAGQRAQSLIQEAIDTGDWEPNSPATIAKKGEGKKPLIDTSHMINSVTYAVREKGSVTS